MDWLTIKCYHVIVMVLNLNNCIKIRHGFLSNKYPRCLKLNAFSPDTLWLISLEMFPKDGDYQALDGFNLDVHRACIRHILMRPGHALTFKH